LERFAINPNPIYGRCAWKKVLPPRSKPALSQNRNVSGFGESVASMTLWQLAFHAAFAFLAEKLTRYAAIETAQEFRAVLGTEP
jgi:hypothetical protein